MSNIYIQSTELLYSSSTITSKTSQKNTDDTTFKDFLSNNDDKQVKTNEVKQTTSNETINQTNSTTQTNINKIKYSSTAYGYSVDSKGFMGVDFNKAAGLPEDFKIHKSTLEEIDKYSNNRYIWKSSFNAKAFDNIDMADTVKQYYKLFEQVAGKSDKQIYTDEDLKKLPTGYSYDSMASADINGDHLPDRSTIRVTHIYSTQEQIDEAMDLSYEFSCRGISFDTHRTKFSKKAFEKNTAFNPNMSVYKKDDGYTRSGVFVGFLKSVGAMANDSGDTRLTADAKVKSLESVIETNNFLRQNIDIDLQEVSSNYDALLALIKTQSQTLSNELLNGKTPNEDANDLMERFKKIASTTSV